MPRVDCVRLPVAEFDCATAPGQLTNSSRRVAASLVRLQKKKCVIRIDRNTISKPDNAAVGNELIHAALDRDEDRIAQKPRSPWSFSIRLFSNSTICEFGHDGGHS
jgi:hypothetical protein